MASLLSILKDDIRCKARWCYQSDNRRAIVKTLCADGTAAMVLYRLMQWSHSRKLWPLAMVFNKLNAVCCNCIIGRGANFGPGFVLIHSTGVVINSNVTGGSNTFIEHQVTIGAERHQSPILGSGVFIGAGAKIIGGVRIGDDVRIGANAVVVADVPSQHTAVGIPARAMPHREVAIADSLRIAA